MSTLSNALRIATGGLQNSQVGIGTISHNIVNANTQGFTRQVAQNSAVAYNGFGAGVQLGTIQRITDNFITARGLTSASDLDYATTTRSFLDNIEGSFSNASADGNLEDLVNGFFAATSQLANSPADGALRRNAVQSAVLLSDTIRGISQDMDDVQQRIDDQITAELTSINTILKRVYDLNVEIATQDANTANGANTNDLKDARAIQVDELAKRFGLQVSTSQNGSLRILTENGRKLVDEGTYVQLKRVGGSGPFGDIVVQNVKVDGSLDPNTTPLYTNSMSTGRIKALIDVRDTTIPNLLAELNEFTSTFMTAFNSLHSQGSAIPPVATLQSGSTSGVTTTATDLFTELSASLAGATFHASVVNSQGDVIATTLGNGGAIAIPGVGPFSLDDLATLINGNADVGNTTLGGTLGITATATTDSNGDPIIRLQTQTAGQYVVLSNVSGNALGLLGMNNFFTGADSNDIAVRSDIATNPDLVAVGRMRAEDGGLSSRSNANMLALSQLADTVLSFGAAGDLSAQNVNSAGYVGRIVSTLAVTIKDANSREAFAETIDTQIAELQSSLSGVNVNEELATMLVYQNSFQASARIVTVVNDLFDTLLGIVR
ncbi:MAG: flagellar hook-associated protein FlgK [Pseudomonadaceae bacterium]|nr:flagellar hook-associated protein FlgK [Pseudomonadaceae bacterium]